MAVLTKKAEKKCSYLFRPHPEMLDSFPARQKQPKDEHPPAKDVDPDSIKIEIPSAGLYGKRRTDQEGAPPDGLIDHQQDEP
jgi:hypothetical protein